MNRLIGFVCFALLRLFGVLDKREPALTKKEVKEAKEENMVNQIIIVTGVTEKNDKGIPCQKIIMGLKGDEPVEFVPDPNNPKSRNAVKVVIGGKHAGWIIDKDATELRSSKAKIMWDKIHRGKKIKISGFKVVGGKYINSNYGLRISVTNER